MNSEKQIDENIEATQLLNVWKHISKKLRKKVENERESPLTLAAVMIGQPGVAWMEPHERKEVLGENLDDYKQSFPDKVDADTIDMIMRIHPAPEKITGKYGANAALDSVAKKTWARWERWGDTYEEHVVPIAQDMAILKTEMKPVMEALSEWVVEDKNAIVDTMRNIFETKRKHLGFEEWVHRRSTPPLETYLTKSQISQLAPELEALRKVRLLGDMEKEYPEAARNFTKKISKFSHILKANGISAEDAELDALNYDCLNEKYTRDPSQINKEETSQRRNSAKNLSKPTLTSGDSPMPGGKSKRTEDPQR
jgi:hypothetical protein